jgi:hypothetical protein
VERQLPYTVEILSRRNIVHPDGRLGLSRMNRVAVDDIHPSRLPLATFIAPMSPIANLVHRTTGITPCSLDDRPIFATLLPTSSCREGINDPCCSQVSLIMNSSNATTTLDLDTGMLAGIFLITVSHHIRSFPTHLIDLPTSCSTSMVRIHNRCSSQSL